jgi:hypothetical protein
MTGELTDEPTNQLKTDWLTKKLTNQTNQLTPCGSAAGKR